MVAHITASAAHIKNRSKENFSANFVLHTIYRHLVHGVIGAIPANFSEFYFVLVNFIEIGGITANFILRMPKQ